MLHLLTQSPWVERTGWVLVHSLWQFALVALLAAVLQWMLRRRSETLRYGVLLAAMSTVVMLPAVTWFAIGPVDRPAGAGVPASAGLPENSRLKAELQRPDFPPPQFSDDLPGSNAPPRDGAKPPAATTPHEPEPYKPAAWWSNVKTRLEPWLPAIVLAWLAGVAIFAFRPMASWYTVRRLRTVGVSPVADSIRSALSRTANQLRITRGVTILQSTLVKTPVVIGYFRPLILLPLCIVTGLPESQLELILAHELAHIRRHDYLINLLQTLIETLFFYHPAVWWLSRRIRHERENCCDDIALSLTANRADYGRALLAIEELRAAAPAFAVAAGGASLLARIRRIAGQESAPRTAGGATLAAFLASIAILAAATWAAAPAVDRPAADASSRSTPAANPPKTTAQVSQKTPVSGDKGLEERAINTKSASWGYRHRRTFLADGGQLNLVGLLVTNGYWRNSLPLAPAQATAITRLDNLMQQAFDNVCLDAADYMDTNPPDYQEYNARLNKRLNRAISRAERMVALGLLTEPQAALVMQRHLTNGSTGSRLYPLRDENVQELLGMTASQISGLDKVGAEANRREAPLNLWSTDPKEQQKVRLAMEANAKWLDEAAMNVLTPAQREIWSQVAAERHLPATPPDMPAPSAAEAARIKVDELSPVFRALAEKADDFILSDKQKKLLDGLKEITREGLFWIGPTNSKNAGEFVKQAEQVALHGILTEKQAALVAQFAPAAANASTAVSKTPTAKPADSATTVKEKLQKEWADAKLSVPRDFMFLPAYRNLEMPDVRKHLGIKAEQEKKLWEIAAEYHTATRKIRDAHDDWLRLPPPQRKTTKEEGYAKLEQARHALDKRVADVLTAGQRAAYQHDVRGDNAFNLIIPDDRQYTQRIFGFELSQQQLQQLTRLREEVAENRTKVRKSMEEQVQAVLTAQQREKLLVRFSDAKPFRPSALVPGSIQQKPPLEKKPSLDFLFASGSNAMVRVYPELTDPERSARRWP